MNKYLLLLIFLLISLSCKKEASTVAIDRIVTEIDANIKNGKYNMRNFSEMESYVQEMTCYFEDKKPVCLQASEGSSYGISEYKFYISESRLIYTWIEYTELKKEYWDTMDTVVFNETNSDITLEQTYFISNGNKLVKTNMGDINPLSRKRERVILDQFNELYKLSNQ